MPSIDDYRPYPYTLSDTRMVFDIRDGVTLVQSTFKVVRKAGTDAPLRLDGLRVTTREGKKVRLMDLLRVSVDGRDLTDNEYSLDDRSLSIFDLPNTGEVTVNTRIWPERNSEMLGLYKTGEEEDDLYLTQFEAEGFRRITYYPDRPDVGSIFTVSITADAKRFPVLLSNGNLVSEETVAGRRTAVWLDPRSKPCYLVAVVAGDLAVTRGSFQRYPERSGDEPVLLEIYTKSADRMHCDHPMKALKAAMRFDQERFDRFYRRGRFMIVAVKSFLYGAMENASLNIFNIARLIASKDIATDDNYLDVMRVVAHEYLHDSSGNAVTLRDFMHIALKEGFTVFRDQEFTASLNSKALQRIADFIFLRQNQFLEDAGPHAHPVLPKQIENIENLYTTTVYYKGAEIVRMIQTLLGWKRFKAASNKYFDRYDGKAVTVEHFVQTMEDASGIDLKQFRRWYDQSGTPVLSVSEHATKSGIRLEIEQSSPSTPGQPAAEKEPLHIPLAIGLVGPQGKELLGTPGNGNSCVDSDAFVEESPDDEGTLVVHLRTRRTVVSLEGVPEGSSVSFLRDGSAPVVVDWNRSARTLVHLAKHDANAFGAWDAAQKLASSAILAEAGGGRGGTNARADSEPLDAFLHLARELAEKAARAPDDGQAKAVIAHTLSLPSEIQLLTQAPGTDIRAISEARESLSKRIAGLEVDWEALVQANRDEGPYVWEPRAVARRKLKGVAMGFAARHLDAHSPQRALQLVVSTLDLANNLTDRLQGLNALLRLESVGDTEKDRLLNAFYDDWKDEELVIDAWFALQAACSSWASLERIEELAQHDGFRPKNPNRLRALYGQFANANVRFHEAGCYTWYADRVVEIDRFAPILAAAFVRSMSSLELLDVNRARMMRLALERVKRADPSKGLAELVDKCLGLD